MSSLGRPPGWDSHWVIPDPKGTQGRELQEVKALLGELADQLPSADHRSLLGPLVGSNGMRTEPVHRWFTYKEGFSPDLLGTLIDLLGLDTGLAVVDVFGGVGTTVIAGLVHPSVSEVRSVEYSPFAHFVATTKASWADIDVSEFERSVPIALQYRSDGHLSIPSLSSFARSEIISKQRIRSLVAARDHIRGLPVSPETRDALLLGVAAVLEDLSGVMKDGRALRIKRNRQRRPSSLADTPHGYSSNGIVKRSLAGQWTAMLSDIRALQSKYDALDSQWSISRGDARSLSDINNDDGPVFPQDWADLSLFSPPYLNCLDYTELYKLELWLLELVRTQADFRETRLGTLRSHPSLRFPEKTFVDGLEDPVLDVVGRLSKFASSYGRRNDVGPTIQSYFDDMYQVWVEQLRVLKPGGVAACVVANSTFSRRERDASGSIREQWRMPVLTDVILAHLARLAGFEPVGLFEARDLRARNAGAASARESVVIVRKPSVPAPGRSAA